MVSKVFVAIIGIIVVLAAVAFFAKGNIQQYFEAKGNVLAHVNGKAITVDDVKRAQESVKLTTGDVLDQAKALEKVINEEILYEEAEKEGISYTLEDAENNLMKIVESKNKTLEDVKKTLAASGKDYASEMEVYRRQMTIAKLLDSKVEKPAVAEDEVKEYYDENKDTLFTGEKLTYEQISVQLKEGITRKKYQENVDAYVKGLRDKAKVVYSN